MDIERGASAPASPVPSADPDQMGSIWLHQDLEQPTFWSSRVFIPILPGGGLRLEADTLVCGHRKLSPYTSVPMQVALLNGIKQRVIMLPWGSSGELCMA